MKKLLTVILFFAVGSMFSQSPEWQQCFSLQAGASRAFNKADYPLAANKYAQMDSVYGRIVDYADMRKYCIASVMCGDTERVKNTALRLTQYKCFDITFFENPIFDAYKTESWWPLCDSLSQLYGHKDRQYIDTLRKLQLRDSIVRYHFIHGETKEIRDSFRLLMRTMDSVNTHILSNLIKEYGLPTWSNVGYEGFHSAYILIMHIDPDLRDSLISEFMPLMEQGDIPRDKMAYFIDRSLILKREPQRYGCQRWRGGSQPIEDIEHLNDRRESMWLWPRDISKIKIVEYD